MEILIDELK